MKISKLFHWLYAILMLLPFAFFVPSVLYYAFNDNATMQTVEVPQTETVAVDFNQLVQNGDFDSANGWSIAFSNYGAISVQDNVLNYSIVQTGSTYNFFYGIVASDNYLSVSTDHKIVAMADVKPNIRVKFNIYGMVGNSNTYFYSSDYCSANVWSKIGGFISNGDGTQLITRPKLNLAYDNVNDAVIGDSFSVRNFQFFDLTQMFGVGNEPTYEVFSNMLSLDYYEFTLSTPMQLTYETGETEQLIENTSIINYAWESIWDLPLFSWTKVTFVSVPFSYLTGIFGIGANNSLNYVFGYFVTISIVWLVFDLLLYVPMLAHNWIDKARIE